MNLMGIISAKFAKWLRFRLLFPALAKLPFGLAYRLASRIGSWDARHAASRAGVEQGMLTIHPELANDRVHLETLVDHYYRMMARDTLDCLMFPRYTPAIARELLPVANIEILSEAKQAGKGVILVVGHFGRTFMFMPGLSFAGHEVGLLHTPVDERNPYIDAIERRYFQTKLRNGRLFSRSTWVTTADSQRNIYRSLAAGEVFTIAFDGTESASRARVEFPFLGGTLALPDGVARIAAKTGAKLVYATAFDHGPGVEIIIHRLPDDPFAAISEAVRLLENDVIAYPWQWWQWAAHGALWRSGSTN